jgi:hypothetical protein
MRRCRKAIKALVFLLVFSVLHLYAGAAATALAQQAASGKLTTRGNQPITVNGISASSGATILSGATVETGDGIGATIGLGPLGTVELAPNTKIQLTFNRGGSVEATVTEGCLILRVKDGTYGVINTPGGKAASNDATQRRAATLDVCLPKGAPAAIINQGAAANAGAGAGAAGATVGAEGLSGAALGSLVAGGVGLGILALVIANRGDNVSPSS